MQKRSRRAPGAEVENAPELHLSHAKVFDRSAKAHAPELSERHVIAFFSEGNTQLRGNIPYRDGYVALPGRRLHYVDYGGAGEIILALHGYVQNAHAFDGAAAALVPHARLLALDIRGRGGSDWAAAEMYKMNYYLNDLRDFCVRLSLSRFALMGTSMGGTLALLYAIAHPREVTRLVLNDVTVNTNRAGVVRASRRFGFAPAEFASMSDALAWFQAERENMDSLDDETQLAWVSHFLEPSKHGGLRFNCDPVLFELARLVRPDVGPKVRAYQRMVMEQATRLQMPVLILRGANSDVVPMHNARVMVGLLPSASCVEVPDVGHSPTLYEPDARRALREFFGVDATLSTPAADRDRPQNWESP
jgi:esterase